MKPKLCLAKNVMNIKSTEELDADRAQIYRSAVGCLIFYILDREDAHSEMNHLGSVMARPTIAAWILLKRVVRYLKGTRDAVVEMMKPVGTPRGIVMLDGYSDSDWADDVSSRKSRSSGHIKADKCPLYGWVRRQNAIATSSAVAEFYAATGVGEEVLLPKRY